MHYLIRRVKCDETKPSCLRCKKFGTKCDGYPSIEKRGKHPIRAVPLKIRPWMGPKFQASVPLSRAPLYQVPKSNIFRNEAENRYFDAFRMDVIPEISGIWDDSFWGNIVLTACDEPFILDAVLAIAAISLSIKENRRTPENLVDGTVDSKVSSKHYRFALERFGRAVRTMRSTLTNDEQDLRKALIGCLLVFCFEGFQGYPKQALIHAISGYHLLQSWMLKKSYPLVLPNSTPPVTSLIEKELMDAFNRLHTNAVTVMGDICSEEAYMLEYASGDKVVQNMPSTFADFQEAHRYFVHIMKRCAVFIQMAVGLSLDPSSRKGQQGQEDSASTMLWGASIHIPFPKGPVPEHILAMHAKHLNELRQWQLSFTPLRLSTDPSIQVGATVLQAGWTGVCMIVNTPIPRTECYWDQFLPEFRAIVSLAKTLFRIIPREPALAKKGGFSLDISIVPPLYIVCKYCRDGGLRREAIALIDLCPGREGVWDSGLVRKVSTFLMDVEEEGMVDGYIPEFARARIQKVAVNVLKKTADVECVRRILGSEGEVSIRRKRIEWD
ncbi:hypothetical protein L207DRAFT_300132 [Hyaloscypha variabilis F]|uniref:Zn(2)-C6 fungal-type domain-containing protein n=1 Tax=Hyaloscypha variabilis (strain UAMH 11265 / GT02V1 / F) TaxID=1149755 RepID=A0A2J6RYH3_HYAVF|nr:hypothetical protein L207DRAFT_300132 [Hyaloscypha variabilis F]